jgi:two-component system chemotaxis response regulator CheB
MDLADLLVQLVSLPAPAPRPSSPVPLETREEAEGTTELPLTGAVAGVESGLTCPECSGILREVREGEVLRFRCRVGHAYTSQTMLEVQGEAIERALWTAVRQLEERAVLIRKLAAAARVRGHEAVAATFEDRSVALAREGAVLRELIGAGRALEPFEMRHEVDSR